MFAAWSGEELGLIGSNSLCQKLTPDAGCDVSPACVVTMATPRPRIPTRAGTRRPRRIVIRQDRPHRDELPWRKQDRQETERGKRGRRERSCQERPATVKREATKREATKREAYEAAAQARATRHSAADAHAHAHAQPGALYPHDRGLLEHGYGWPAR